MPGIEKNVMPALIPHEQFHKGIWLLSVKRPQWYYYMESDKPHHITNEHFSDSVDPPLKELVNFLHKSGIETTPSCAGHHKSKKEFEQIYDALEKDKKEIRKQGLQLRDIESGKIYFYRNKHYLLPWSKKKFLNDVLKYQENGVIGIRPGKEMKNRILHIQIPGVRIIQKDAILIIETLEHSQAGIRNKWRRITREIKKVFSGTML